MKNYDSLLREALVDQHKSWFDPETKRLKDQVAVYIDCPACESKNHQLSFRKDWFCFSKCQDCSMVFLNPRANDKATYEFYNGAWNQIYNEQKFYARNASIEMDQEDNRVNLSFIEKFSKRTTGNILEIGPGGEGTFLELAQKSRYKIFGVELNKENCSRLEKKLKTPIENKTIFDAKFSGNFFDIVYMRDVLEHVPNPRELLSEINRILQPGGILFIQVPNIEGLIYRFAKKNHVCIFGFEHLNYWAPKSLNRALEGVGYKTISEKHESLDFRLMNIANYLLGPLPFTSLRKRKVGFFHRWSMKIFSLFLLSPLFRYVDKKIQGIPDSLSKGSVLKLLARKN